MGTRAAGVTQRAARWRCNITTVHELTHHSVIAALLQRHGLAPDKRFGQNFLVDSSVITSSLAAAEVGLADTVLEVGPGLGVLTRELLARAEHVHAIEFDVFNSGVGFFTSLFDALA